MPGVEAVLFDIGNVAIEWQRERPCDGAIGDGRVTRLAAESGRTDG